MTPQCICTSKQYAIHNIKASAVRLYMFAAAIFLLDLTWCEWVQGDSPLPVIQCVYFMETSPCTGYFYLWMIMKMIS